MPSNKGPEILKLKTKRSQCIATMHRIERFILEHEHDELSEHLIEQCVMRKEVLSSIMEKISEIEVEVSCLDNKFSFQDSEEIEHACIDTIAKINLKISKPNSSVNKTAIQVTAVQAESISTTKLPHIDIPFFDGKNLSNFKPFFDMFLAVIDKNRNLSDVEKLFYLRNYLKNEALCLISNLPIVNQSYKEAIDLLKHRYDNESILVNCHLNSLIDILGVQKGTTSSLREFVSNIRQHVGALKNLGQKVEYWDALLVCIFSRKLDQYTNRAYQIDKDTNKLSTLEEFLSYLENRATALEAVNIPEKVKDRKEKSQIVHISTKNKPFKKCQFCSIAGHKIYTCKRFLSITPNDRVSFCDKNKICKICLCKHTDPCKSSFRCDLCYKGHNTLLHLSAQQRVSHSQENIPNTGCPVENTTLLLKTVQCYKSCNILSSSVLLPTVQIQFETKYGEYVCFRGLIDSCSQGNFVTKNLVKTLQLKTFPQEISVSGISENSTKIQEAVNLKAKSCHHNYEMKVTCSVIDKISNDLPQYEINTSQINIPPIVKLADSDFFKPGKIDFLFGANIFFKVLLPYSIKCNHNRVILQSTLFGFVVSGTATHNDAENIALLSNFLLTQPKLEDLMSKFWEAEKVPELYFEYFSEQEACETVFQSSVCKTNNKFQVKLPLKQPLTELGLGDSFSIAYKRFQNLEKRFKLDSELFNEYKKFIHEYLNLNHAKIIDINKYDLNSGSVYFMAHHPVIRNDKKSTRLRVVFDGSMKTKNKKSLNDLLYNGAVVQNELFDILILFRTYKYVILTDIKQMYRMVLVDPEHCTLQNILWRDDPKEKIQCLQLQTITYGLKCSPFLATRCLVELAKNEEKSFPLASKAILNNTYVDDVLTGGSTIEEAITLKNELIELLNLGSFQLHKWCSNNTAIISDIPSEKQHFDSVDISNNNSVVKTLGISYNTLTDDFKISCPNFDPNECVTKRQILSFISKLYDPLGFVGPVVVGAKIIMQKLWVAKLEWDEILPNEYLNLWKDFANSLANMPEIIIPRNLRFVGATKIDLVGFCDASPVAYGAVLYIRVVANEQVFTNLLCSKSRISPINKELTIPKLELNSALLLSKLASKVQELLKSHINQTFLFSDSTIVLCWLKTEPVQLNTYVANRVEKIQKLTINAQWLYVNTKENPADALSRGLDPQNIKFNNQWFCGPDFLAYSNFSQNYSSSFEIPNPLPEKRIHVMSHAISEKKKSFFQNFSNFSKLVRIVAYMLRFVNNARNKEKQIGNLMVSELNVAQNCIIRCEQGSDFLQEIKCLKTSKEIKSNLRALHPFLDKDNILRVGGRLQNANIPYSQKHPIILPKNNHVTDQIIIREHLRLLHAGQKQVLSSLNLNFWIINGVREIKRILHQCVTCFKAKAKCSQQLMGSLPEKRVNLARPFQNIGIDFCGPFYIKQSRVRKVIVTKAYIALFVCFSTKAIHMELLSDMTTENFIGALKRFIYRRGKPSEIYCDNGSTFKGAANQLEELYSLCKKSKNDIIHFSLEEKINFHFIPSYSPVFGGLWEAGVKSAKFHIKRVMGNRQLTYEQLYTMIVQVEGILNSRPLTQITSDPSDLSYLTPGHFLIGVPLTSFPEPDITNIPENKVKFWRLCTQLQQHFWKRFYKDYLSQLQSRPKWQSDIPNVQEGMLVLLKDDNSPSLKWPMARILKVIPGSDGKVRVVQIKTENGIYLRSITKIAVLPIN